MPPPAHHRLLAGCELSRDRLRNDVYNTPIPGGFNVYRPVYNPLPARARCESSFPLYKSILPVSPKPRS